MKNILSVCLLLCWAGVCPAQPRAPEPSAFISRLSASVQRDASFRQGADRWRLSRRVSVSPSDRAEAEETWTDKIYAWLTVSGKEKDAAKIRAVSGYLFNMYIHALADGKLPAQTLTLDYAGVLDPLETGPAVQNADWLAFYGTHKPAVKNALAGLFARRLNVRYAPEDARNDAAELWFLQVLKNSAVKGKRAGYRAGFSSAANPAPQEVAVRLAGLMRASERQSERLVTLHRQVDVAAAVDQKNRMHKQDFYRSVRAECAACSYVFCRNLCAGLEEDYQGWKVERIYKIAAVALKGRQVRAAGGKAFESPDGSPYPAWMYHEAAVTVLSKGGETVWLAADSFLFENPVPLAQWAQAFDGGETAFYLYPFRRQERIEKGLKPVSEEQLLHVQRVRPVRVDGRQYKPLPVNR